MLILGYMKVSILRRASFERGNPPPELGQLSQYGVKLGAQCCALVGDDVPTGGHLCHVVARRRPGVDHALIAEELHRVPCRGWRDIEAIGESADRRQALARSESAGGDVLAKLGCYLLVGETRGRSVRSHAFSLAHCYK